MIDLTDTEILQLLDYGITPVDLRQMTRKLTRNAARCLACGDTIESVHRHDMRSCTCGNVAVDGDLDYFRRVFQQGAQFEDANTFRDYAPDEVRWLLDHACAGEQPPDPHAFQPEAINQYRAELAALTADGEARS